MLISIGARSSRRLRRRAAAAILLLAALPIFGHGTEYEILAGGVVGVRAAFDTGLPMAEAPVLIFAPGESRPEQQTTTDRRGIVCFAPDRPGTWVLQIRAEGGHGMRINLEVDESMLPMGAGRQEAALSAWQKLAMAACGVWGFLGTALFFRRRRRETR